MDIQDHINQTLSNQIYLILDDIFEHLHYDIDADKFESVDGEEADYGILRYLNKDKICVAFKFVYGGDVEDMYLCPAIKDILEPKIGILVNSLSYINGDNVEYLEKVFVRSYAKCKVRNCMDDFSMFDEPERTQHKTWYDNCKKKSEEHIDCEVEYVGSLPYEFKNVLE